MMYDLHIDIRPAGINDKDTIYGTWISSLTRSRIFQHFPQEYLYVMLNATIDKILDSAKIMIACDPDDNDQIFGYIVYDDDTIFWIYTKYIFRKAYVATRLIDASIGKDKEKIVVWNTPPIKYLEKKWNLKLNPQKLISLI